MSKKKMYFKMITASLIRKKSRMIIAVLAISISAAIMSGLVTIYYDIPRQLGKEFRSYGANLILVPEGSDKKLNTDDLKKVVDLIGKDKIVGMAPYRYQTTKINEQPYILAGTKFSEAKANSPFWYIEGKWVLDDDFDNVMIGKEISKTLNLKVGDEFVVQGVKYGKNPISSKHEDTAKENKEKMNLDNYYDRKLKVKGIITTGGAEESFIFLNMNLLDDIIEDKDRIDVTECSIEANEKELRDISQKVEKELNGIFARPVKRVTQSQDIVLTKLQTLVYIVNAIVLILTMVSVTTTMTAVVAERKKEIGLKKALGATNEEIIKEFLGEGVILGVLGGITGSFAGFIFAQKVSLSVFGRAITFQYLLIPVTIFVSVAITVLACMIPVRSSANVEPAIVLRGE